VDRPQLRLAPRLAPCTHPGCWFLVSLMRRAALVPKVRGASPDRPTPSVDGWVRERYERAVKGSAPGFRPLPRTYASTEVVSPGSSGTSTSTSSALGLLILAVIFTKRHLHPHLPAKRPSNPVEMPIQI
jgi:hypothetical protein